MECPKCKNPVTNNFSTCDWCGYQLSQQGDSTSVRLKKFFSKYKKHLYVIVSVIIFILLFLILRNNWNHWFLNNENKDEQTLKDDDEIIPKTWEEKRAFEYLTNIRNDLLNKAISFEKAALKFSQDTLNSSYSGRELNNNEFKVEFDQMADKLEVNQLSEIFKIKGDDGYYTQYAFMKLLDKGKGFYKVQYITRNIKLEIGQYYQGGNIIKLDENHEHGLIAYKFNGAVYWTEAKKLCEDLEWKGFDDWRLPTVVEIDKLPGVNNLDWGYWCSEQNAIRCPNNNYFYATSNDKCPTLAVRSF